MTRLFPFAALTILLVGCVGGVSKQEFEEVQEDLRAVRSQVQSFESQLHELHPEVKEGIVEELDGVFDGKSDTPCAESALYEAEATIIVQSWGGEDESSRSQEHAAAYRLMVTSRPFLERLHDRGDVPFDLSTLVTMVSAATGTNPPLVHIRARHADAEFAAMTANVVSEYFIEYALERRLAEIARLQAAAAAQGISLDKPMVHVDSLTLVELADVPAEPLTPLCP